METLAQSSRYSFFGGKQSSDAKEINTASEQLLQPKNKQVPGGMEIGTNHFQTDSLKAHKASKVHTVRHLFWQPCTGK